MEKQQILKNVRNLTAEQLFDYIRQGKVTLRELQETGDLVEPKRNKIGELQRQHNKKEDEAWERARYGNEMILSDYISNYPAGNYVQDAKDKIKYLEDARRQAEAEKQNILDNLRSNHNSFTPGQIKEYLKGTITKNDLHDCGIPKDIVDIIINNFKRPDLDIGAIPDSIPDGYTEVYFWGIPGAGKTCALAAILSKAEQAGYLEITNGPGYNYMTLLKNIFSDGKAILPYKTKLEETQYLPFVLTKGNDKPRSVSLIELSGELFQCFFKKNANKELSDSEKITFDTLIKFLNGKNRKIHFFFVDFSKQNKKDDYGYTQSDYLNATSTFFKKNDFFGRTTDAVYVVLTKSDLMPCKKEERVAYSKQHLQNNNFAAFINILKHRCNEHSINAGKLMVEPFSLGKVYFEQICDFDSTSASRIIDILIERIKPNKKSILDVLNN